MTPAEIAVFERMTARMTDTYKGEEMAITAACRAVRCDRANIFDGDEAVALLIEAGWSWSDVLNANS